MNNNRHRREREILRIGFVPLSDCAPLVMAHELGLFRKHGLSVTLHRELGWATIRDKIIYGELDAAHALAAMPFAATLGLGSIRCDCAAGLVLNLHGNAITISKRLRERGVCDATTLRLLVQRSRGETFTFGAVATFSSHHFLLRQWLASAGMNPERDVRIVTVPPPQMVPNLRAGHLDGFCVGEPWNSVAVQSRVGWCVATSAELAPGHPEKVLMVRQDFAENRAGEHIALVAALLEACAFCDKPENHDFLITTLARPEYVGAPESALSCGIRGQFDFGDGVLRSVLDFAIFHRDQANEPSSAKAAWVLQQMRKIAPNSELAASAGFGRRVFRQDIFDKAISLCSSMETGKATRTPLLPVET